MLTGAQGDRGPVGLKGDKGETGDPGPPGKLSTELRRDLTLRGRFHVDAVAVKHLDESGSSISFGYTLAAEPQFQIITVGGTTSPECPGSVADPRAGPGYLCFYVEKEKNLGLIGVSAFAFGADITPIAEKAREYLIVGSWAVTGS